MLIEDMIKEDDYVTITNEVHANVQVGDVAKCIGCRPVNEDKDDLYNLRLKLIILTMDQETNKLMSVDDGGTLYYVDAKSLEKVDFITQETLEGINDEGEAV